jgi:hypothetical protein
LTEHVRKYVIRLVVAADEASVDGGFSSLKTGWYASCCRSVRHG